MKHDAPDLWRLKPDQLPIEDAPCMGKRAKKTSLQKASKKHLWDLLKQSRKELLAAAARLIEDGIPTKHVRGPGWASMDCYIAESSARGLEIHGARMAMLIEELERRM